MIAIKNNNSRANAARIFFYLLVGMSIISLYSNYLQYQLLSGVKNGIAVTPDVANANDSRQQMIVLVNALLLITSSILFLVWIYRAYENLYSLKINHLSCTPGWAVGYWFVPVISLFKPYVIVKEIWDETQAYVLPQAEKKNIAKGYIIGLWWTLYLLSIFSSYFVVLFFGDKTSIDGLIAGTIALIVSNIFLIVVKVVTLVMINKISLYEKSLWGFVSNNTNNQPIESIPTEASVNVPGV
ncbi:MAG: DUF4328 domain-containing protein [Bacteroidia bacterium]